MQSIIEALKNKYNPSVFIVYGSFASGTNNDTSDFDAVIVADIEGKLHDDSYIGDTKLDVFVYDEPSFSEIDDPEELIQIFDGKIIVDNNGLGTKAIKAVNDYIKSLPPKTKEELAQDISWCCKMLLRADSGDAEGYYRWHWLLTDSLMIYSDTKSAFYPGPKKTLEMMEKNDPKAFAVYSDALRTFGYQELTKWVNFLSKNI